MSKRKRSHGPTMVDHRLRTQPVPLYTAEAQVTVLGKRAADDTDHIGNKRNRRQLLAGPCYGHQKRSAEFDIEIDRLHKRLRATVPSAEEAIAFFLPHMIEMRRLYLQEQSKHLLLQAKNTELHRNNALLSATLRTQLTQNNLIKRQLDMALYRLAMPRQCQDNGLF
jgi:hypothetical protein